ncbi:MAG TPA: 1,4-alpha-glucan branching protein GlgB [Bryobacteraceae bacterium]|nr:1,4-alpha-glucan branching protein GlgB [Bryobacteraceae bacterium]
MATMTTFLTSNDLYYFREGTDLTIASKFGAHLIAEGGRQLVHFAVWAPNAQTVSVIGDFNHWTPGAQRLEPQGNSGVWAGFVAGLDRGARYKYHIVSQLNGYTVDKADPVAFRQETPPGTASIVWDLDYEWNDAEWMARRKQANSLDAPMSIYEVHLGSWRRDPNDPHRCLSYRELAEQLVPYVREMGFTHVEFLPVMEHPFYGSWGYQGSGYFAPTSRYGTPQDLMWLIDRFHQEGIGVILDWVPSHFPRDEHGLGFFDGAHEYEHADPRQSIQPDWNTFVFNHGRNEVRSFLLSSAAFWLERYHADGLRVDAVASMLYLDYSRKAGEWIPNQYGGRENLAAIAFLRDMNRQVYERDPAVQTIAEESTAWPMVSRPLYVGGLGFGMKWDMGWMHDTLKYLSQDPLFRKYHHHELTFRMIYAFSENFVLPLSHDEVVYGKGSLLAKMRGDDWQKFANLRVLFSYMYAQPGKKLLFMGGEFGQWSEWNHDKALDWDLLASPFHSGLRLLVGDLNHLYRDRAALHDGEFSSSSFEWIDDHDSEKNVLSFLRKGRKGELIAIVCNFSPVPRPNYRIGVPAPGFWKELLNTDAKLYGGSGQGNMGGVSSSPVPLHGRMHSLTITLPPLAVVWFEYQG